VKSGQAKFALKPFKAVSYVSRPLVSAS